MIDGWIFQTKIRNILFNFVEQFKKKYYIYEMICLNLA